MWGCVWPSGNNFSPKADLIKCSCIFLPFLFLYYRPFERDERNAEALASFILDNSAGTNATTDTERKTTKTKLKD